MANIRQNYNKVTPTNEGKKHSALDTLAQLERFTSVTLEKPTKSILLQDKNDAINTLQKRAISKYYTNEILYPLIDLKNERNEAYWNTWHCVNILMQNDDGTITAKYCKNRWCIVCNRIRTGILINTLSPQIKKWKDKKFVTLTTDLSKTCFTEENLRNTIGKMQKAFERIWWRIKRKYGTINAIRKLEITWNDRTKHFHPHYHIILENISDEAVFLVTQWLKEFGNANEKAQDIRIADDNSVIEMFKYFTKMWKNITNEDTLEEKRVLPYPAQVMDTIFKVMHKKRTIQQYGKNTIEINEDFDDLKARVVLKENRFAVWHWMQDVRNWVNFDGGELRV